MQTARTYPLWQHTLAASQAPSGFLAYARAATLSAWLFCLTLQWWWITDWFALQELFQQGVDIKGFYYYGFAIALIGHLTLGLNAWITAPFRVVSDWTGRLMAIFCVLMFVLSPMSLVPRSSMIYAMATAGVIVLFYLFWVTNYRVLQRVLVFTAFLLFSWLLILLVKNGLTFGFGGIIGGVNRNITGTAAVAAMICGLFANKPSLRWAMMAAGVFFAVIVSSRGSMVGLCAFFAAYFFCYKGTFKLGMYAICFAGFLGAVMLVSTAVSDVVINDIFHLHDRARGIGSGFTGRVDMWKQALSMVWKQPLVGYGFRSTTHARGSGFGGIHSAYLKILLEAGFIGGFFIIAANVNELIWRFRFVLRLRRAKPHEMPGIDFQNTMRINVLALATLCLISTIWIYEQYYVNLGSAISLIYLLMLFSPRYITSHGLTVRA